MRGLKVFVTCFGLFCSVITLAGKSLDEITIDATRETQPPPRGRGPFPGSSSPGHSVGFPVRLDLKIATGKIDLNSTTVVDFVITNIGTEPLRLPVDLGQNTSPTHILTLYLTFPSDAIDTAYYKGMISIQGIQGTNAELYGHSRDPKTFFSLAPNKAIRVHTSERGWSPLKPGTHSITAHIELLTVSEGRSEVLGTAESIPVETMFSAAGLTVR